MTDKQKLEIIDAIVARAYEWEPGATENRGTYFEGIMCAIFAVLVMEGGDNNADS